MTYQTCLVTGAGGFIGSHLTERLLSMGKQVRALANYRGDGTTGWLGREAIQNSNLEIVRGDVRDSHQVRELVDGVEVVFHLAALIGIPHSFDAPASYTSTNLWGTQNLLEASRSQGVKAFIQTSTSEVYGTAQYVPMSESHPINPQSPYAASKVASDAMAMAYFYSFDLPLTIVRPFNTFGPRQSARAVIPSILAQLLDPAANSLRLGNLDSRRDFTFVADTVEGFALAAEHIDKAAGETLNLGAGWDLSIRELVERCERVTSRSLKVEPEIKRLRPNSSEVEALLSDNSRARQLLGWTPSNSSPESFDLTLTKTSSWINSQIAKGELFNPDYQK